MRCGGEWVRSFMSAENAEVVHRWFEEVWNRRNLDVIEELMHEECLSHGLMDNKGIVRRGPEGFRMLFHAFTGAYPDMNVGIEETVCQGDKVVVRCVVRGTHTGHGIGVPPTGKTVEFTGLCIIRVAGSQIVEAWNQYDFMKMYGQLGVLSLTLG